jgi:hypothetical protein
MFIRVDSAKRLIALLAQPYRQVEDDRHHVAAFQSNDINIS